jgi:hypothetical protein
MFRTINYTELLQQRLNNLERSFDLAREAAKPVELDRCQAKAYPKNRSIRHTRDRGIADSDNPAVWSAAAA